jgi:hypothetical protein
MGFMAPFRVRDLMIDVVPTEIDIHCPTPRSLVLCGTAFTRFCRYLISWDPCRYFLTRDPCRYVLSGDPCGAAISVPPVSLECPYDFLETIRLTPVINPGEIVATPQELGLLKTQLRQALANVEEHERLSEQRMRPQTMEEVDMLEQRLTAALEEIKGLRDQIAQRKTGE